MTHGFSHPLSCTAIAIMLALGAALSCTDSDSYIPLLDEIRVQGDTDPAGALRRMDSISISMTGESRHTAMRYELLRLRLLEKAEIMPESDVRGKDIYRYFMDKGSDGEKMEASYYLASIYRDLHDSPRAIRYFRQALDIAESSTGMDSVTVANAYSQLSALYRIQYDYNTAMEMAERGLGVARKLGIVDPIYIMDVATIAYMLNDTARTARVQGLALDMIRRERSESRYADVLCEILSVLSEYHMTEEAERCRVLLDSIGEEDRPHNYYSSLAIYYKNKEDADSSIYYFRQLFDSGSSTAEGRLSASRNLAALYARKGNVAMSQMYAMKFIETEEEYRRELQHWQAVRAHNEYVYSRDQAEEERIHRESEEARGRIVYWALSFALLLLLSMAVILIQRYRSLKRIHEDMSVMDEMEHELRKSGETIREKEAQILEQEQRLRSSQHKLDSLTRELGSMEQEVASKDVELRARITVLQEKERTLKIIESELQEKESLLVEKMKQNERLFGFAFAENISRTSDVTLKKFNAAAEGKRTLTDKEWKELFSIIEDLYPDFRESVMRKIKRPSVDKLRIAYLLKAGMTKPQIVSLTNYPTTTVWRKVKYLTEVLEEELHSIYPY